VVKHNPREVTKSKDTDKDKKKWTRKGSSDEDSEPEDKVTNWRTRKTANNALKPQPTNTDVSIASTKKKEVVLYSDSSSDSDTEEDEKDWHANRRKSAPPAPSKSGSGSSSGSGLQSAKLTPRQTPTPRLFKNSLQGVKQDTEKEKSLSRESSDMSTSVRRLRGFGSDDNIKSSSASSGGVKLRSKKDRDSSIAKRLSREQKDKRDSTSKRSRSRSPRGQTQP
jgi:hypothetical protein